MRRSGPCCCCYRKGTNFQANHNKELTRVWLAHVVVATAKVQIFKQIATSTKIIIIFESCCCYRKGTNFQANHNHLGSGIISQSVVVATAKVQIFKQITTRQTQTSPSACCCCYRKGTNFQANHNALEDVNETLQVVVATAKVQIFKQITTEKDFFALEDVLLLLPQRYKFSSKSQLLLKGE